MPNVEQRWISYAEFGERFVTRAVTAARIAEAVAGLAGRGITIGPFGTGPLGLASVRADGKVNAPVVAPAAPDVSFALTVPVSLELALTLGGKQFKVGGQVAVGLLLHARTAGPLLIVIDVPPVREQDVTFSVRAEAIGAAYESMLDPITGRLNREVAARVNGLLGEETALRQRVFDVGSVLDQRAVPPPLPPYQWISYGEFGQRFFPHAITPGRIEEHVKALEGQRITVGPLRAGPGGAARIKVNGQLALPQLTPIVGELVRYALRIPVRLDISIKTLGTGRFTAEVEIPLTLTARAAGGRSDEDLHIVADIPAPAPSDVVVTVQARDFWARLIGADRVRGELAGRVIAVVSEELADDANRTVDVGAVIDQTRHSA